MLKTFGALETALKFGDSAIMAALMCSRDYSRDKIDGKHAVLDPPPQKKKTSPSALQQTTCRIKGAAWCLSKEGASGLQ